MADKLSYEELEQRVGQLDKEVAELKRSFEGWRSLVKNAPSPIITVDRAGIIRDINQAVAGLEIEKVVGTSHYDYASPEYHKVMKESVEQVFKTGKSVSYEIAGVGPEGSTSWYVTRLGPVKRGGEVVGVTIVPMDITERKRMEEELRENEQKYRALVESSIDGICIVVGQEVVFVNSAGIEMFGCQTADEMVGHVFTEFVSPEHREVMIQRGRAREQGEDVASYYGFKALRKDGTQFDAEISASAISYNGSIARQGVIRDITERKRLEDELRESEERYRAIFEGAAEGIVVVDVKTRKFRYINPAMCRMFGYSRKEFVDMGVSDIHPEEAMEHVISEFEAQMREEKTLASNIPCLHRDGTIMYADINTTHMVIDGKECNVGFFADITERKEAEEALRDSEEKWRSLTENSVDYIMTLECDGTLLFVNRTPSGVTKEEVIGTSIFDHFPEKFKLVLRESINRVVETGEPDKHYIEYTSPDGITRHFEGRAAPIIHSGRVVAITINATDITEHKLVEQALRERETSLEIQADELQEINTALRVLLRQRDKDKAELEEKVFLNVRELVMPHVEKLKKSTIDARQKGYLRVLESNLNEIISPFAHRLSSKYSTLTPTEIQMAFLIRDGKSTKEIADLLSLSGRTVESHRQSIRVKMGIRNRRANLRSHLLSM